MLKLPIEVDYTEIVNWSWLCWNFKTWWEL